MSASSAVGMLHLAAVNPYILSSLEPHAPGTLWMPRAPSSAASTAASGVSGFAFQGTNAHVVLLPAAARTPHAPTDRLGTWECRRHWFAPPPHRLLELHMAHASRRGDDANVLCGWLQHAQHAHFWQHMVNGRSILPGAAMFEAAASSAACLVADGHPLAHHQLCLRAAAISAPLLLKPPASAARVQLTVHVYRRSGQLELSSSSGSPAQVHLAARAACVIAAPSSEQPAAPAAQQAVLPLLLPLLPASACDPAGWQGEALAVLSTEPLQPGGFACHPAVLDASTHFGAVLDTMRGTPPRVPVALDAYLAGSGSSGAGAASSASLFAVSTAGAVLHDNSRRSSFGVLGGRTGATSLATLTGLRSQPLSAKPTAATDELAEHCYAYDVQWQAAMPAPRSSAEPSTHTLVLASAVGSAALRGPCPGSSTQQAAVSSFSAAVRLLRTMQPGEQLAASSLCTPPDGLQGAAGPGSSGMLAGVQAAAVAGLLKVAALEEPLWRLSMAYASQGTAVGAGPAPDAHGMAAAGGVAFHPRMLLCQQQPGAQPGSTRPQQVDPAGLAIITGGLGGLGLLAATALLLHGQSLLLLGRSGRLSASAPGLLDATTVLVTLQQCDVAVAADACSTWDSLQGMSQLAATALHTAGTLADALVRSQSLSAARRVMAPKLAGLASMAQTLQLHPLRHVTVLHSRSLHDLAATHHLFPPCRLQEHAALQQHQRRAGKPRPGQLRCRQRCSGRGRLWLECCRPACAECAVGCLGWRRDGCAEPRATGTAQPTG